MSARRPHVSTPLRATSGPDAEQVPASPAAEDDKGLLVALSGLSRQITEVLQNQAQLMEDMADIKARLTALEEGASESGGPSCGCSEGKRKRRAQNPKIAETVRRLHNCEENTRRYDPAQGLSSPYNEAVTSHLVAALASRPDMKGVDTGVSSSACKTYYETVRRNFRYNQPNLAAQAAAIKSAARSRQRRKRLLEARRAVLAKDEMDAWSGVTIDMMSDEEDGMADGEVGWIVRPPSFRSRELSELCAVLQERLERDPKYVATHHKRLRVGSPSDRAAQNTYEPEAAKRHIKPENL
ncbi:uncharacterized protein C14orf93-like [Labrus mixtus]|uniref:uncharacterized protein C14orf93-like n=1 Tax=Labrus mixtus TaxID=508554 RepID=UPI0029C0B226|nr:uncharacterized protein C14orf93-like [Labrus mixtus]